MEADRKPDVLKRLIRNCEPIYNFTLASIALSISKRLYESIS